MRRLLSAMLFVSAAQAALPAGAQWNLRTDGSDLNGGFFNTTPGTGTDYSDQAAAQLSVTDGATTTTTLASVTGGFTSVMVHNGVQLSGGTCTAGFYEITVFTNTNTVTIDRSGGTGTGCTVKVGGSLLTHDKNLTSLVDGNTTWTKYNATKYTRTTTLIPPSVNSGNGRLLWRGYDVTHGDETANRPTITTSTNSTKLWQFDNNGSYWFSNMIFENTAGTPLQCMQVVNSPVNQINVDRVKFTGCTVALEANFSTGDVIRNLVFTRNEMTSNSLFGVRSNMNTFAAWNWCHDSAAGFCFSLGPSTTPIPQNMTLLSNCVYNAQLVTIEPNTAYDQMILVNNTVIAAAGAAVASNVAVNNVPLMVNNIFQGGGTGGAISAINLGFNPFSNGGTAINRTNAYGNNTGGNFTNWQAGTGDVTLSADPTVSASTGNCALSAGGITALQGLGFPGVGVMGTGHITIGALEPTGGGSSSSSGGGRVF